MKSIAALTFVLFASAASLQAEESLPITLMTRCGNEILSESFEQPLAAFKGKPKGFASGFSGWRYNVGPRGGQWDLVENSLHGSENAEAQHPATASYGFDFQNAVIAFSCRMDDVPLNGRKYQYLQMRTTDENDYVSGLHINSGGMSIVKEDNDHAGPDKSEQLARLKFPVKAGDWQTVVVELLGDEVTATVNGHTLTGQHPLFATPKHSIMFVIGNEGSIRNLRIFEAKPNPDWDVNRARIQAATKAAATADQK